MEIAGALEVQPELLTAQQLKQNDLFVQRYFNWRETEVVYEEFLQEIVRITHRTAEKKRLHQYQEKKIERKDVVLTSLKLLSQLEEVQSQKERTQEQLFVSYCVTRVHQQYKTLWAQIHQATTDVKTLHAFHFSMLQRIWDHATEKYKRQMEVDGRQHMAQKGETTLQSQGTQLAWKQKYEKFKKGLLDWLDSFLQHQKGILLLGKDGVLHEDLYAVLETIQMRAKQAQSRARDPETKPSEYMPLLLDLHRYWVKLQTKWRPAIHTEMTQLDRKCMEKGLEVTKQRGVVDQHSSTVRALDAQLQGLYRTILGNDENESETKTQLRTSIWLKNQLQIRKPQLEEAQKQLRRLEADWQLHEEKRQVYQQPVPAVQVLEYLQRQEKELLETHSADQATTQAHNEKLDMKWHQTETLLLEQFRSSICSVVQQAHAQRRRCEWEQWARLEAKLLSQESPFDMLVQNLLQTREESIALFGLEFFEKLVLFLRSAWTQVLDHYVENRVAGQEEHCQNLFRWLRACEEETLR